MTTEPCRYVLTVDGREIELSDGEVTIGRSRTSTVRIDHESVSRSHALLTLDKGEAVLKDLNSSNGTYVGGRRVLNETRLAEGDRVQLGAAVIAYRVVWTTRSDRTTHIDTEADSAGPPPAASPQSPVVASPASPASPATGGSEIQASTQPDPPAASEPEHAEPVAPPPLEISVPDLGHASAGDEPVSSVAAASALEAVRISGEPPPTEPPRPLIRIPAPPKPPPPPPVQAPRGSPSLASVPIRPPARSERLPHPSAALPGSEEPAGFGARFLAQLVDGVVLTAVNIVLLSPVFLILFFRGELQPREAGPDAALLAVTILCALLIVAANLWYVVGGWAKTGRTPGKSLLKIAVVVPGRAAGSGIGWKVAFLRALGTVVSTLLVGIGYLIVLVRRDRRALHDLIAGTRVVRLGR